MRFKVDENLPQEVAQLLGKYGHEAESVFDESLSGQKDPDLFEVCQNERRALMTLDLDFANIQVYPPGKSEGIVVLRLLRQDKPRVLAVVEKLLPVFAANPLSGKLWIVEEDRVRIRG